MLPRRRSIAARSLTLREKVKTARRTTSGMLPSRGSLYYIALMHGAHAMYRSSVEKSTKRTYKTAELRWVKLTKRIGTDPFMRTKKNSMASWRPQLRQYDGYVGRNLRARILRVDAPQAANITARYGVQLPVHHSEIPPEWWRSHQLHGKFAVYQQHEGRDENCIP